MKPSTLAALVALIWWVAYLKGNHEALELVAALGFTLAWFIVVMGGASSKVDRLIRQATGKDKG
jgi:hypothetical protein